MTTFIDEDDIMPFEPVVDDNERTNIIKVVGVGGGGGNAVNHMYREGIMGVTFALCNTDNQALLRSPIPVKLQLGPNITKGLGAGNKPEIACKAAEESKDSIRELLNDGTQMVFITAGMGGGTGTGAAPVIARIAKEMGILTIGIVTIPFLFEGKNKIIQALEGVDKIKDNVDALMLINNQRLLEIYPDFTLLNAFKKADDTLSVAARSIVEIINMSGSINLDFADVCTTLRDSGVAIISTGIGEGENRLEKAIQSALHSPLLNDTDIIHAQRILFNISFSLEGDFMTEEMDGINEFMQNLNPNISVIWGSSIDNELGSKVKITLLASGFDVKDLAGQDTMDLINVDREEEENNKIQRILEIYGSDNIFGKKKEKKYQVYIFKNDDLDNDELIFEVEELPTYVRKSTDLRRLVSKSRQNTADKPETQDLNPDPNPDLNPNSNIIQF